MRTKERQVSHRSDRFEELFRKYRPIVEILHKKYYLRDYDLDDWLQEGRIVFNKCLKTYDKDKGTTIGILFKRSFENRICSLLRAQHAQKRKAQVDACSLEEKLLQEGNRFLTDHNRCAETAETYLFVNESLAEYPKSLSSLERMVIMNYLKGLELDQIAAQEKLPYKKIKSAFSRGRTKLIALIKGV